MNMKMKVIWLFGCFLFLILGGCGPKKESNEEELNTLLEKIGSIYYEEIYYPQSGKNEKERIENIKKDETLGITITLAEMKLSNDSRIIDNAVLFVNTLSSEECDDQKTKVKIIPMEPYKNSDYKLETTLVCGF